MTQKRTQKKGWLYKRGGQLSSYKLKWAVLYDAPIVVLHLFDNRDSVNPKHVLYPDKLRIQVPTDEGLFGSLDALVGAVQGGRRGTRFRMIAHDRKYSLSAQSKKEREEWIATIQSCSSAQIMNVKGAAYDDDEANQTGEEEEEEEDVRGMLPKSASLHSMESIMTSNKGIMTAPEPLVFTLLHLVHHDAHVCIVLWSKSDSVQAGFDSVDARARPDRDALLLVY